MRPDLPQPYVEQSHDPGTTSASGRPEPPAPPRYDIASQRADAIYQSGGNQYNYQQYYALRIAPMLDRARRLLRWGVALMLAATAIYLAIFVLFGREIVEWNRAIFDSVQSEQEPDLPDISFAPLAALPVAFVVGFAGFVMVVIALMTRRRAEREERGL